jgi:hypothetical protein
MHDGSQAHYPGEEIIALTPLIDFIVKRNISLALDLERLQMERLQNWKT